MKKTISVETQDLISVVNIIDTVTKRGAFNGNELLAVGSIRTKFENLVTEATKEPKIEAPSVTVETLETPSKSTKI